MKCLFLLVALFAFQSTAISQIKIGDVINIHGLNLIAANNAKIDPSKITVLDFWATWCAPCIAAFPHLVTVQDSFKDTVQVIAVSDESPQEVSAFLQKRKFPLNFFIDKNQSLFKRFEVDSRPLTAIIAQDGKLQWVGSSKDLELVLRNLANKGDVRAGVTVDYSNSKYYPTPASEPVADALYSYQISHSNPKDEYGAKTQKGVYADKAINIYYRAVAISEVVQDLLGVSDLQLTNNRPDLDTLLVNITAKSSTDTISYNEEKDRILSDLQRIFRFTIKRTPKTVDSLILTIDSPKTLSTFTEDIPGGGMVQTTADSYNILRLSLSELAGFFQKKLKTYISFEGSDTSKFNLQLKKFKSLDELNLLLIEKYGLRLTPGKTQLITVDLN